MHGDGMLVERHAGRHHHAVKALEVDFGGIGQFRLVCDRLTRFLAAVPCHDLRSAPRQAFHRGEAGPRQARSEEHTSELQSLMRISYAVFCLKKKNKSNTYTTTR